MATKIKDSDPNDFDRLLASQIDLTGPEHVEIAVSPDGKRIWVNVNNVCVLRCCRIGNLNLDLPLNMVMQSRVHLVREGNNDEV